MSRTGTHLLSCVSVAIAYCEIEFEDRTYELGGPPDYSRDSWKSVKFSLGLAFPNLPYYIDKHVSLTQSNSILRYIARYGCEESFTLLQVFMLCLSFCSSNHIGSSDARIQALEDMVADVVVTIRDNFGDLCYSTEFESIKQKFMDDLPQRLAQFNDFMGENEWMCGDTISYADFHLVELLRQLQVLEPDCLRQFTKLEALCTRFESLPRIAAYKASKKHVEYPLFSNLASFGSTL
jgi:glutathione S-transferase